MSQSIMWKNCTGFCMNIEGKTKNYCINCENHDTTKQVLYEEFYEKYNAFMDAMYEQDMMRMAIEEDMNHWMAEMEADAPTTPVTDGVITVSSEEGLEDGLVIFDISRKIIDLVWFWHSGSKRKTYFAQFDSMRLAMEHIMYADSTKVSRHEHDRMCNIKQLQWLDLA